MAVIDVQVHAYEPNHPGRPWVGQLHGPASATGEEMVAAMDAVGVDGAIIVSTFNLYRYDPSYALEVYARYPDRFRAVKPIDPADPAVDDGVAHQRDVDVWAGRRALPQQRSTVGQRSVEADGRSAEEGLWLVADRLGETAGGRPKRR